MAQRIVAVNARFAGSGAIYREGHGERDKLSICFSGAPCHCYSAALFLPEMQPGSRKEIFFVSHKPCIYG